MKKLLFVCVASVASLFFSKDAGAQQVKIGYFDEQQVLPLMPGFSKLDTSMAVFQSDSLGVEFNYTYGDYHRRDSIFKKDSATMPAKARELAVKELNQLKYKLSNWSQYAENVLGAKQEQLLQPFRIRIQQALAAIVAEQKYTHVLNSSALSLYVQPPLLDNLAIRVAMRLKLALPKEIEDAWKAASGGGVKK